MHDPAAIILGLLDALMEGLMAGMLSIQDVMIAYLAIPLILRTAT